MDYINRMKTERSKLISDAYKLRKFRSFENEDYKNTTFAEKCLIDTQIEIMQSYLEILTNRIILAKEREDNSEENKTSIENKEEEFSKAIDKIMDDFMKTIDKFLEEGEE